MSSRRNVRKKSGDRLNRKALYEKHIPNISEAIGSIVSKSRNHAFKMRCQRLLQVDDSANIQEAVMSKLFMLTLGDQYNSDRISHTQEHKKLDVCCHVDAAYDDLAYQHENDDEQWSFCHMSDLENTTEEICLTSSMKANSSRGNDKESKPEGSLTKEYEVTEYHGTRTKAESTHMAFDTANVASPDDDFESLDFDLMFTEFPFGDEMKEILDQKVPCCYQIRSDQGDAFANYQSVMTERTSLTKETSPGDDDDHFETLGIFVQY